MSRFAPKDFAEALQNRAEKPAKPRKPMSRGTAGLNRGSLSQNRRVRGETGDTPPALNGRGIARGKATGRLQATSDPELAKWGRTIKKRDENRCQWPACDFCRGSDEVTLDPHHKALRSARPDLRLILSNGTTVCRQRHDWIHSPEGHDEAVSRGFLNIRTRELAAKEGTLGSY